MKLSVIIVHYKVKDRLFNCLESIKINKPNFDFEVLVVDNDEAKSIEKELKNKYEWVKYIKNPINSGYGAGNNLGAKNANGEFLFFLNPDTIVINNALDSLVKFIENDKKVGIVAPLLLNKNEIIYPLQGTQELTPIRAVFSLTFLSSLPFNVIYKRYWLLGWNKKKIKEIDVAPGTAFLIRKKLFDEVGGFDENFFLYFEEFDICRRVRKLGYKIFITPDSKLIHYWGESTKFRKDTKKIFNKSRFLYFKKNFGLASAIIVQLITGLRKEHAILSLVIAAGAFLRLFRLNDLMMFFGDQGWFYLSARDIFLDGEIPLVGITSSHTWLHQGPLWTYILSVVLKIFNFNPLSGAYFTAIAGIFSVFVMYKVASALFSEKVGLISASIFAFSPLVVIHSRMAYHTSLIPLFTLVFIYFFYRWLKGEIKVFPFIIACLAILYNLELATAVLWFILVFTLCYGFWKRKVWVLNILNRNTLIFSFILFFTIMLPVLAYDISHGFPQTVKFAIWIFYSFLKPFYSSTNTFPISGFDKMAEFFLNYLQRLIFLPNQIISNFIFITSLGLFLVRYFKTKRDMTNLTVILLFTIIPLFVFLINKTPSEAYLPILFPAIAILIALMFDFLLNKKNLSYIGYPVLIIFLILNGYSLINNNYLMGIKNGYGPRFSTRTVVAKEIVQQAQGKDFVLKGEGRGSQFESFTMNYEYLTWWFGGKPVKNADIKFVIMENDKEIFLKSQKNNRL